MWFSLTTLLFVTCLVPISTLRSVCKIQVLFEIPCHKNILTRLSSRGTCSEFVFYLSFVSCVRAVSETMWPEISTRQPDCTCQLCSSVPNIVLLVLDEKWGRADHACRCSWHIANSVKVCKCEWHQLWSRKSMVWVHFWCHLQGLKLCSCGCMCVWLSGTMLQDLLLRSLRQPRPALLKSLQNGSFQRSD